VGAGAGRCVILLRVRSRSQCLLPKPFASLGLASRQCVSCDVTADEVTRRRIRGCVPPLNYLAN
jgi:hypothetical protein